MGIFVEDDFLLAVMTEGGRRPEATARHLDILLIGGPVDVHCFHPIFGHIVDPQNPTLSHIYLILFL